MAQARTEIPAHPAPVTGELNAGTEYTRMQLTLHHEASVLVDFRNFVHEQGVALGSL